MFHAFAHTCVSEKGHQFYYHRGCANALSHLNVPYRVYIPFENMLPPLSENWIRHFPRPYDRTVKKQYLRACYSIFQKRGVFFIETLMRRDVRYFSLGALRFGKKEDQLIMLFRDNNLLKRKRDYLEVKFFLTLLHKKFQKNLHLFTDTDNLTSFFIEHLSLPFQTLPIPLFDIEPGEVRNEKLTILFPGEPRGEKGGHVVARLLQEPRRCHFITSENLPRADEHFPNVLPRKEYLQFLKRSDVIILPYEAEKYRYRSSGIFMEGISLGKLTLVPDGCWMADELKKHNLKEMIVDFEKPHFLLQVEELAKDRSLKEKLKKMQRYYLEYHTSQSFAKALDKSLKST